MELATGCAMCHKGASHLLIEANQNKAHAACEACAQKLVQTERSQIVELADIEFEDVVHDAL